MKNFHYIFQEGKNEKQIACEKQEKKAEGYQVVTFLNGSLQPDKLLMELIKNHME